MVGSSSTRSDSDKEKTKLRERQRRAITTKIFHGLRRHGGYHLSPRADINEVLRQLASEAGWIVDPDGTTYRYKLKNRCPTCGALPSNASTTATLTTSSTLIAGGAVAVGTAGECSTTTSTCYIDHIMLINSNGEPTTTASSSAYICRESSDTHAGAGGEVEITPAFYMYRGGTAGDVTCPQASRVAAVGGGIKVVTYMQEARASNQSTPVGSPLHPDN